MSNQSEQTNPLITVLKVIGCLFGLLLIGLTIPVSVYCAQIHIWPEHGRFGDAEMRLAAVTIFFMVTTPVVVSGGNVLVWFCSKWMLVRVIGWILCVPMVGTFLVLLGKLAGVI